MGCGNLMAVFWHSTLLCINWPSPQNPCKSTELVIGGSCRDKPPQDTHALFQAYPVYRERASQFLSKKSRVVGPAGLLYVQQREMAVTTPQDESVSIMGSDDATSCIIGILRHKGSGAVGVVHFDGVDTKKAVDNLVRKVQQLSKGEKSGGRYELSLVGGVLDSSKISDQIFSSLMYAFRKQVVEIHLVLACIGELNTREHSGVKWPIVYGAGINTKNGETFPATFSEKGPEEALRSARCLTGGHKVLNFYDYNKRLLCIGPFKFKPMNGIDYLLSQTDKELLQKTSTTPDVEPPNYATQMRKTLEYIKNNPSPDKTVFQDNKPRCYERDKKTKNWIPISVKG